MDPGPPPADLSPEAAAIREDMIRTMAHMDEMLATLNAAGSGTGKERTESRERNLQPVQVE